MGDKESALSISIICGNKMPQAEADVVGWESAMAPKGHHDIVDMHTRHFVFLDWAL
jgi:hypothetical protein